MAWKKHPFHRCKAPDCQKEIPNKHVMCPEHWTLVPRHLQAVIIEQWKYGIVNHCHPTGEYLDALGAAQKTVREKLLARIEKLNARNVELGFSWTR